MATSLVERMILREKNGTTELQSTPTLFLPFLKGKKHSLFEGISIRD